MFDPTKQVEQWYTNNVERLAARFTKVEFTKKDLDPSQGGVTLELEGPTLLASLLFWCAGDVSVAVLKKGSERPLYLDDRKLGPDENVSSLLDSYLRDIENLV